MGNKSFVLALILLGATAYAKEPKAYQSARLLQMDSAPCRVDQKNGKNSENRALLCQEYTLQTDRVIYHIRPRDEKHPVLLPVGGAAQFRLDKNKMLVRVETLDNKEREYVVVSMTPLSESTADANPVRLNHLQ